jgi:3-dehydroquinate dehydratase/shikimate dehydrogenase
VIVTCRASWEGGRFTGSEEERQRILTEALDAGAEYVDVEAAADFAPQLIARRRGKGMVVSHHDFTPPPHGIEDRYRQLRAMGAEVSKLAVASDTLAGWLPLLGLDDDPELPHVVLAMGSAGLPSRVLAARLRSRWTYAGAAVAPGQITADRLLDEFQFRRAHADTRVYGVVGKPIGHSRSPVMHNAGFAALDLNAVYVPFEAANAEDLVQCARALDVGGISITAPFKVSLMPFVDDVDPVAREVGAINTLVVRDGRWLGYNTDVEGFLAPLRERMTLRGARATVLGAGGAARGVAVALAGGGAAVTISARRGAPARDVAELVGGAVGEFPPPPGSWDLLVNATSAGTARQDVSPMAGAVLDGQLVYDLVYEPADTRLLLDARAAGCATIGGLDMLIAQAERQFELWTGQRPPAGVFRDAALARGTAIPSHTL